MPDTLNPDIQRLRNLVLLFYYGLFVVLFLNSLGMTTGLSPTTLVMWILQVAPLTLFSLGLHRARVRTYQWLSFVVLMYFVHGVLAAFTPGRLTLGISEVTICCLLFVTLIVFIRKYQQLTSS